MSVIKLLQIITKKKIIVPFYHTVADEQLPHIKHLYRMKTVDEFLKDLDFLLKHFKPIDIEVLNDYCINRKKPKNPVFHLTFDDGMKEIYEIVAPILLKKGIPATFFINSGFADNKALFYRHRKSLEIEFGENFSQQQIIDFLNNTKPYLTTEQIQSLNNQGFTIGAHSIDHPYYYTIPLEEQLRQTRESLHFVTSIVNQKLRLFAFPFTDFNVSKQFFEEIKPDVDLCFGTAGLKNDVISFNIQRIGSEKDKLESMEVILKKAYLKYMIMCALKKTEK
jgi:peptidoglycan/xylan/chitin deacetylase (PgdA/CDA1 family)